MTILFTQQLIGFQFHIHKNWSKFITTIIGGSFLSHLSQKGVVTPTINADLFLYTKLSQKCCLYIESYHSQTCISKLSYILQFFIFNSWFLMLIPPSMFQRLSHNHLKMRTKKSFDFRKASWTAVVNISKYFQRKNAQ